MGRHGLLERAFQSPEGQQTAADVADPAKFSPDGHSAIYQLEDV